MRKQYILYIVVILLSIINIINTNNTSALSYSSSVGVGFTFNPTLSVNISSDLIINNLVPGSSSDSNIINISVATNASYGYTLSATVGDSTHDNSNLTHSNNTNVFSSIAINADLSSLDEDEDTNIWGYSYRNNITSPSTWSNYNGLSSSSNAILLDNSNAADSTGGIDFKIGAKASSTQASGTYAGTINFTAVTNVAPMSLLDSFIASGAEQLNGYFKMQDMTHSICSNVDIEESELQLIDVRDNKIYWVAKLKDGNCWMTQNLDLDLDSNRTYTHWDTDLGWSGPNNLDVDATWIPINSTINFSGTKVDGWVDSYTEPYSASPGHIYYYTSNSDADDIKYNSLQECINAGHNDCTHYHVGNYYNWSAAVASNDTSEISGYIEKAGDSICPSGWKMLGTYSNSSLGNLLVTYNVIKSATGNPYFENGFTIIRNFPLYLVRSGYIDKDTGKISLPNNQGYYYSDSARSSTNAFFLKFTKTYVAPNEANLTRGYGQSVRCLAR